MKLSRRNARDRGGGNERYPNLAVGRLDRAICELAVADREAHRSLGDWLGSAVCRQEGKPEVEGTDLADVGCRSVAAGRTCPVSSLSFAVSALRTIALRRVGKPRGCSGNPA